LEGGLLSNPKGFSVETGILGTHSPDTCECIVYLMKGIPKRRFLKTREGIGTW